MRNVQYLLSFKGTTVSFGRAWIRIRIVILDWIPIRIKQMRIRNSACRHGISAKNSCGVAPTQDLPDLGGPVDIGREAVAVAAEPGLQAADLSVQNLHQNKNYNQPAPVVFI